MIKRPCCYYCKSWDGTNASKSHRGVDTVYAFCNNPNKLRLDTGSDICPAIADDVCTDFEPVEGWTDEWKRIIRKWGIV